MLRRAVAIGLALTPLLSSAAPKPDSPAAIEFFEKRIRPVLVDNCYKCHSRQSEKVRGGLLLDTKDGLRTGGDSGPSIVPGHPEKSLLFKAVSYTDKDLQMPPKDQKLADAQINDLRTWIKMGAPDPRIGTSATTNVVEWAAARQHWAFQPVTEPAVPKIRGHKSWAKNPLDAFVLENLNAKRLNPSSQADKRTLIRRATFDLIGLPPTPAEVHAFLADKSKDAFAKLVDRLLASPHYGERWGRYWLDVARYADTKGNTSVGESPRLPYAYTYRDYVVRSFNEDLPYNQFIKEQIAADLLPASTNNNRRLAAMGFLTVGRQFFGNQDEIIDDRIDVVSRGLLGLTVACARCHDHKFDPIPTRDYYSLHGVFNSSIEPTNPPLLTVPLPAGYSNYLADIRTNEAALHEYVTSNELAVLTNLRAEVGDYLLAVHDATPFSTNTLKIDELVRSRKLNKAVFLRWQTNRIALEKTNAALFQPWFAYTKRPQSNWSQLTAMIATNKSLNRLVAGMFKESPTNLTDVASRYDSLFGKIPDGETGEELHHFLEVEHSPANPPRDQFAKVFLFDNVVISRIKQLRRKIVDAESTDPGAPPRAMVMEDRPHPVNTRIYLRGNAGTRGAEAPRRFLEILDSADSELYPKTSSGRLQLAGDIANPRNPLAARVFVNRVWMHHFGAPLVATPSDFGVRTPQPLQAKLLDYLAARFMAEGWSVKKLHRLIMLSAVYQQDSAENADYAKVDPDNTYLWRMNPQRLDFETMRDSLLFVSGKLDETIGGQPVEIASKAPAERRTIYGVVDRENLPDFYRMFDFPDPGVSSAERFETIVAPQALFLLNSPFLAQSAHDLVQYSTNNLPGEDAKIRRIYELLFQREPTAAELGIAKTYLTNQPAHDYIVPEPTAWEYGWSILDTNSGLPSSFDTLSVFNGLSWKPAKKDAKAAPLQITATGGATGRSNIVAIRRWTAPRDGMISVHGELARAQTNGTLRGRIISSRTGVMGEWVARDGQVETTVEQIEVRRNDTIDFVVDNFNFARPVSFRWAPSVEMARKDAEEIGLPHVWDAKENFVDPKKLRQPMGPWEKYAQVLLFSNEFFFVD